ncbi:hypothetical protein [Bradyrhizobium elkanii]|uniref:hypothetical protein n=1 Tax=Bradyrhizobium elkanii TaxID=29448 RepID=UPI0020A19131|nr:hypothetical protein [Bradyrhizobium elkanii]MCP1926401.1 hypothetical protein [Bradyrhizobium elkanii]
MTNIYCNLPEVRESETDPPQIGVPSVATPVLPRELKGGRGPGRLNHRKTIRSAVAGFFRWKKLRFGFKGKKEVVVEEIK